MDTLGKIKTFIQSWSSNVRNSQYSIKTNFPISKTINLDENSFQGIYDDLLEYISLDVNNFQKNRNNSKNFDSSKYGLPFMEKINGDMTSVMIEMLITYDSHDYQELFNYNFTASVVKIIQEVLIACLSIDGYSHDELICFVLKSDIWYEKEEEKQRLRFSFPGTKINKSIINNKIIPMIVSELVDKEIIRKLHKIPKFSDWKDIIKPIDNFILMYGCKYSEVEAPLLLDCIYKDLISQDIEKITVEEHEELISRENDFFDSLKSSYFQMGFLDSDKFEQESDEYSQLAIVLSANYQMKITPYDNNIMKINITEP